MTDKNTAQQLSGRSKNHILNISHELIASHLGSAREVVTRMLKYFQNEGMVTLTRGAIQITDAEKLEAYCEE